jgi:DNA helicase II / ATP-dependent DNA helicase PcrA
MVKPKPVWSSYQQTIFADMANPAGGNTFIEACAGAGKSTVLIEGVKHMPKAYKRSILVIAFNRAIAMHMKDKLPSYATASTVHSLGYKAIREHKDFKGVVLNPNKTFEIVVKLLEEHGIKKQSKAGLETIQSVQRAVSLCKSCLIDTPTKTDELMDEFDVDTCELDRETFIKIIMRALRLCRENKTQIDYDDMVWMPCVFNLPLCGPTNGKWKMVLCDEYQDFTPAMTRIAMSAIAPGGRCISAGDPNQNLYSFRGTSQSNIDDFIKRMNAKVLPLSISYRCPKSVVRKAQTIVPSIQAAPWAKEGLVEKISSDQMMESAQNGDYIISRLNAPLIYIALALIKAGKKANIKGRDIGAGLSWMIKKSGAKSVPEFLEWLREWLRSEIKRLEAKNRDTTIVEDKAKCLEGLCDGAHSLEAVQANIKELFSEGGEDARITLGSVHAFKGGQADRCFVLADTLRIGTSKAEDNIGYVAFSRSKEALFIVSEK